MSQLLTIKQAAEQLAQSEATIRKWIYQGRLPSVKNGRSRRVRQSDIDQVASNGLPDFSVAKKAA